MSYYVKGFFCAFFLILTLFSGFCLEIGATFRIENISFRHDRRSTDTGFNGRQFPLGCSVFINHKFSENLILETKYAYDEILRNKLTGIIIYKGNFFAFGVGPFLGFFNTSQYFPKFGVSSLFRLEWPGVIFAEIFITTTILNELKKSGNYLQENSKFTFGFYVPSVICSFDIITKRFVQLKSGEKISDVQRQYIFTADIFRKNVPFKIKISLGYQNLKKTFDNSSSIEHTLNSILIGTRLDLEVTDALSLLIDLQASLYTFGADELAGLSNPGPGGFLFRVITGFSVNFDKFFNKQ
jgi:hypothetical protein